MEQQPQSTLTTAHRPARPQWRCRECGAEWPCPTGKAELLAAYANDRVGLLVYLAGLLVDAVQEVGGAPPHQLMSRFVGWAKTDGSTGEEGAAVAGKS